MFNGFYKNKKILITGHTGFKGTWLTSWLLELGANIIGVSNEIPSNPSMFVELNIENKIKHSLIDIRDFNKISKLISYEKPDIIFHLAAQAIVSESYHDPLKTISTNVIGTTNILESLKNVEHNVKCILITSDKSYFNLEWPWGYKETDRLGGKDIYSGSKAAADILIESYFHAFLKDKSNVMIAVGRAGNVIGGGDWAKDRIIVDCMRAWNKNQKVEIRSPKATRPWQHVLEPLSGYLTLGMKLNKKSNQIYSLSEDITPFKESNLLKLNCDKALFHLQWESTLDYDLTHKFVSDWYFNFYQSESNMFDFTISQIKKYTTKASDKGLKWTS